ncbi:MAG: hypothetical protein LBP72_00655 [Dysgonamonadaceae bacterium]|nr:hypothetical protein [Dysgonamonadaceae bacterium]
MSIKIQLNEAVITDLVISCRIAKKKVEDAMICAVGKLLINKGISVLKANLTKTKKNGPLVDVFSSLPFKQVYEDEINIHFQIDDLNAFYDQQLIHITYKNNCNKEML